MLVNITIISHELLDMLIEYILTCSVGINPFNLYHEITRFTL